MKFGRRATLKALGSAVAVSAFDAKLSALGAAEAATPAMRPIPSTGEQIPVVGLGSWITFNVGDDPVLKEVCADVIAAFFNHGGRVIDSSPMYGSSQATIGYALEKLGRHKSVFSADKIWTSSADDGPDQFDDTAALWGVKAFDLMQVHNLVSWPAHLDMLLEKKAAGEIRYVGITTSHGRRHGDLEKIMRQHPIDFVQLTYNVLDREPERRLLPLAEERGIAVIVNRPYRRGALINRFSGKSLPKFAADFGAKSWPQLLLKFILAHPGVTCAIPATRQVAHVKENMMAASGRLPEQGERQKIIDYVSGL